MVGVQRSRINDGSMTVAELMAIPHLGLQLIAGAAGADNVVRWTHTSELEDPGPWFEGGELLIVNGFGIPQTPSRQIEYLHRLAEHRLAGIVVSVRAPVLTDELLRAANQASFPILRIPRQIPFIELSYIVANANERASRDRLARHVGIYDTLRLRNTAENNVQAMYEQLEKVSGYRLALVTPAMSPLLADWPWVPTDFELDLSDELQVVNGGYVVPLFVGRRVTAYLIAQEHVDSVPEGLTVLQHISTLAALDAVDVQRRREAEHRQNSTTLASALEQSQPTEVLEARFANAGIEPEQGFRLLGFESRSSNDDFEIAIRDWLYDRARSHLMTSQGALVAVVACGDNVIWQLASDTGANVGVSGMSTEVQDVMKLHRQAMWALTLTSQESENCVAFAEDHHTLTPWLNSDRKQIETLSVDTLRPVLEYDEAEGTELLHTLRLYFHNQGQLRATAAQLYIHEHTLRYRLKRITELTGRNLKSYRDAFELWLAVETSSTTLH
ncbi:PucR family transcriptional regulator [Brevibacterium permense]|nr:PucR family transcriptional regulator [Brevibacterium permense]